MIENPTIHLGHDPATPKDAFWYWIVGALGAIQAFIIERLIKEPVWRSFDGRVNTPRTMSDRHLSNTIAMLDRWIAEGEGAPPQYTALLREFEYRQELMAVRAARAYAELLERERPQRERKEAQLALVPVDYNPPGWIILHGGTLDWRGYKTEEGAKVSLNQHGTWSWWRPHLHHIACTDPKTTLDEALAHASPGIEA